MVTGVNELTPWNIEKRMFLPAFFSCCLVVVSLSACIAANNVTNPVTEASADGYILLNIEKESICNKNDISYDSVVIYTVI